jgi:ectoine hydroxylase-related dioxygenase (phytanoyl-CoA dioxygenase family)
MLTLRVHLDDCGPDVGPLRVKPGSHRSGRLSPEQLEQWRDAQETTCLAARGDVLAFAPLLLHASSASRAEGHRRVLQLEYARDPLPGGLAWRWHGDGVG